MLELSPAEAAIIACHDDAAALDALPGFPGAFLGRIAADELWLVAERSRRADLAASARARLPRALILDQTDGWSVWRVGGREGREALDRLMLAPVPDRPGLVQGAIGGAAGKVISGAGVFHLMVPSALGHHLRDRLLVDCGDLGVRLMPPTPFTLPTD